MHSLPKHFVAMIQGKPSEAALDISKPHNTTLSTLWGKEYDPRASDSSEKHVKVMLYSLLQ